MNASKRILFCNQSENANSGLTFLFLILMIVPFAGGCAGLVKQVTQALLSITSASMPSAKAETAYSAVLTASGGTAPYSWSVVSGSLPTGLNLSGAQISGTPSQPGNFSFAVQVTDSSSPVQTAKQQLGITVAAANAVQITSTSIPAGQVGSAYSTTLAATGGVTPYTWSLSSGSLPGGLTLVAAGTISGTPTTSGSFSFTVKVTDSTTPTAQTAAQALSLTINSDATAVSISTSSLPSGQQGTAYNATLAASGGTTPYSWSVSAGSLPSGLSITPASGAISGTPTASGTYNFTVEVTDSTKPTAQTATKSLTLTMTVAAQPIAITTTSVPSGTVGDAYSTTLAATGGTTPYSWSISSGALPGGLTLSTSGTISGTPTASGSFNFTAKVTDSTTPTAQTATQSLTITVASSGTSGPVISPATPTVNQGATTTFTCGSNCGTGGTWSCDGCAGTINPSTGAYTAPATVTPQQWAGGQQILPNNAIYNVNISSFPVCASGGGCGGTSESIMSNVPTTEDWFWNWNWPINYLQSSEGATAQAFDYTSNQNGNYYIPHFPTGRMEGGWINGNGCATCNGGSAFGPFDPFNSGTDHHTVSLITDIAQAYETYGLYAAGTNPNNSSWTAASGVGYNLNSFTLPPGHSGSGWGTTDWAGMLLLPATLRLQEWMWAVQNGGSINHAARLTLATEPANGMWPASPGFSTPSGGGTFAGMRFQLSSSYSVPGFTSSSCSGSTASTCLAAAKVLLTQMQNYGIFFADGGGNWNVTVEYADMPLAYRNALLAVQNALDNGTIPKSDWQVVDDSQEMLSSSAATQAGCPSPALCVEANVNRETVCYAASTGTTCTDIVLVGPAVNFDKEIYYIQAGAPARTLPVLNNYGGYTCSGTPPSGWTLSSGCVVTPASTLTGAPQSFLAVVTSSVNSNVGSVTQVVALPSGVIRLLPGQFSGQVDGGSGNYTDSDGNTWYAQDTSNLPTVQGDCGGNWTETPFPCWGYQQGNWGSGTDITLYDITAGSSNDTRWDMWVPNGTYSVVFNTGNAQGGDEGEVGYELQGADTVVDVYQAAGGPNKPYSFTASASVTNNLLSLVVRSGSNDDAFISSFSITQTGP